MYNSPAGLDKFNERILTVKIAIGLIDDKPIFDSDDAVPKLDEADIFIVVKDAELLPIADFDAVVEHQFADCWDVVAVGFD
jgi:hypothetical protein